MDTARLLKNAANVLAGASLAKVVAVDLAKTARRDAEQSPYLAAGICAALAFVSGLLMFRKRP